MEYRKIGVGHFESTPKMKELVNKVIDSGRISYGPMCEELESSFAKMHGCEYGVVSASGTDSLRAALHGLKIQQGWKNGAEVIVPATTFVATINIVTQIGLSPVLVDVDPLYYCMDPSLIESAISEHTVAVMPVNLLGQPADLSAIMEIADKYDLNIVEDSAEAMFVSHHNAPVGSWSDVGCFSFYMAHLITAGVGGIAITYDSELRDIMRSLLNHGREPVYMSIDDDDGLSGNELKRMIKNRFRFIHSGYSSRMTELQAALALAQLYEWEDMVARRQAVASRLKAGLRKHANSLQLPAEREEGEHSYMMFGIVVMSEYKDGLVEHLENNGVETRDMLPLINQPIYPNWFPSPNCVPPKEKFPVSQHLIDSGFYIGCHQGMSDDDADYVCKVVDDYFSRR